MMIAASPSTASVAKPTTIPESCIRGDESNPVVDNDEPNRKQSPADAATHTPLQSLAVMSSAAPPAAPASPTDEFLCQDCRRPVKPGSSGVRIRSRTKKIYQCANCNSKRTVLSYALGGWPTNDFRSWDEATKMHFYRTLRGKDRTIQCMYARTQAHIQLNRKIGWDSFDWQSFDKLFDVAYSAAGRVTKVTCRLKDSCDAEVAQVMEDILSKMTQRFPVKADGKDPKAQTRSPKIKLRKPVSVTRMPSVSSSRKKKEKQLTATKQAAKRRKKKYEVITIKAKKKTTNNLAKDCEGASL